MGVLEICWTRMEILLIHWRSQGGSIYRRKRRPLALARTELEKGSIICDQHCNPVGVIGSAYCGAQDLVMFENVFQSSGYIVS